MKMKHLKIFESFDKYDFKKYTKEDGYVLHDIYRSMDIKDFQDSDLVKVREILPFVSIETNRRLQDYIGFKAKSYKYNYFYSILYLGDYCYSLVCTDDVTNYVSIEIFDDIDPLLAELRKIKYRNEVS